MKAFARTAALGTLAFIAVLAFGASPASAQSNKCLAGKTNCVNKNMSALLKCHIAAEKGGLPLDPACLQKVFDKFNGGGDFYKSCFRKLEIKNEGPCLTTGDLVAQQGKVIAFVWDVVQELDPAFPAPVLNLCSAGKKKCVLKKAAGKLKCDAKCQKDPAKCGAVLTECLDKVEGKFDGAGDPTKSCFAKLEANPPCLTTGDSDALEDKVEAFILDVLSELQPSGPCSGGSPFPVCGGTCPGGQVCSSIFGTNSCECVSGSLACSVAGIPQCGGDCPVNQSCAVFFDDFCVCQ